MKNRKSHFLISVFLFLAAVFFNSCDYEFLPGSDVEYSEIGKITVKFHSGINETFESVKYDESTWVIDGEYEGLEELEELFEGTKKQFFPSKKDEKFNKLVLGYNLVGWKLKDEKEPEVIRYAPDTNFVVCFQSSRNVNLVGTWEARSDIPYQVKYLLENEDGTGFDVGKTESFQGTVDTPVKEPEILAFEGYEFSSYSYKNNVNNLTGDGLFYVEVIYTRKIVELKFDIGDNHSFVEPLYNGITEFTKNQKYGSTVTLPKVAQEIQGDLLYEVLEWHAEWTDANGEKQTKILKASEPYVPTTGVVFTAIWSSSPIPSYYICGDMTESEYQKMTRVKSERELIYTFEFRYDPYVHNTVCSNEDKISFRCRVEGDDSRGIGMEVTYAEPKVGQSLTVLNTPGSSDFNYYGVVLGGKYEITLNMSKLTCVMVLNGIDYDGYVPEIEYANFVYGGNTDTDKRIEIYGKYLSLINPDDIKIESTDVKIDTTRKIELNCSSGFVPICMPSIPGRYEIILCYKDSKYSTWVYSYDRENGSYNDLILKDGTIITFDELWKNQSAYKDKVAAIILGECRDGYYRALGVNFSSNEMNWCTVEDNYLYEKIQTSYNSRDYNFYGDYNGADNWNAICEQNPSAAAVPENYPPFYFANNYGKNNGLTGNWLEDGWYLPTAAEMMMVYNSRYSINEILTILGKPSIDTKRFWTSCQDYSRNVSSDAADFDMDYNNYYYDDDFYYDFSSSKSGEKSYACAMIRTQYRPLYKYNFVHFLINSGNSKECYSYSVWEGENYYTNWYWPPVYDGYVFRGWYSEPEFINKVDYIENVTSDQYLYAKYEPGNEPQITSVEYSGGTSNYYDMNNSEVYIYGKYLDEINIDSIEVCISCERATIWLYNLEYDENTDRLVCRNVKISEPYGVFNLYEYYRNNNLNYEFKLFGERGEKGSHASAGSKINVLRDDGDICTGTLYEDCFDMDFETGAMFCISLDGKINYTSECTPVEDYIKTKGVSIKNFENDGSRIEFDLLDGDYSSRKYAHYSFEYTPIEKIPFTVDIKLPTGHKVECEILSDTVKIKSADNIEIKEITLFDGMDIIASSSKDTLVIPDYITCGVVYVVCNIDGYEYDFNFEYKKQ